MIIGNNESRQTLQRYINMFFSENPKTPHFLIFAGPQHIGKSTIITELLKEKMGNYFVSDLLHIKDFSEAIEKKHSIKIEYKPSNETAKNLLKDYNYQDIGVREINSRMQQSAIGKHKIVFIENIERMTNEAANAFLKTCEEPLPKRLIIATSANARQLMETILSRALTITCNEIPKQELSEWMDNNTMFTNNPALKTLVENMAMGKPGIVQRMYELINKEPEIENTLIQLIQNLTNNKNRFFSHDALKKLYKYGILEAFIDGWIAYCTNNNMEDKAQRRLTTKKLIKTNVNIENLLLYGLMED